MSRFQVGLAQPQDDPALRRLLEGNPMSGSIELAFLREPNYFLASRIQAPFHQVVVARDSTSGQPVGVGLRGVRPAWINGRISRIGYLGDLRLDARHRGGLLVARGYRFFRELHAADGQTPLYLTVIADENRVALKTIASGRAGLPRYRPLGRLFTPAIDLRGGRLRENSAFTIVRGGDVPLDALSACLERNLSRRQFAPVADLGAFGLQPSDFYVAMRGRVVVGAVARWDQSAFRQTRVVAYHGALRIFRPLINASSRLTGRSALPSAGRTLRSFYASFIAIDDDDVAVFRALLRRMQHDEAEGGYHYFVAGLHERDPLLPALDGFRLTPFHAQAFAVHFEDGAAAFDALDGRVPYVEPATL